MSYRHKRKLHLARRPLELGEQQLGKSCCSNNEGDGSGHLSAVGGLLPTGFLKQSIVSPSLIVASVGEASRDCVASVTPEARPLSADRWPVLSEDLSRPLAVALGFTTTGADSMAYSHLVERLITAATLRAQTQGAYKISPRHLAEAAWAMQSSPAPQPLASVLPFHYCAICETLAAIKLDCDAQRAEGIANPRILVIGDTSGVLRSMFYLAGADVVSCDFKPSQVSHIPHYEGDGADVHDAGFDMVISHPPCTFLSNLGSIGLPNEPSKRHLFQAAAVRFVQRLQAKAPFVAVENPAMSRIARKLVGGIQVTQHVWPCEHGLCFPKPVGMYLSDSLPQLEPQLRHATSRASRGICRAGP